MTMVLAFVLSGCAGAGHKTQGNQEADDHGHSDEILFNAQKQEAFGVSSQTVQAAPFAQVIRTSGEILPAQGDEQVVVARTSGIVIIRVSGAGSRVSKGSVIASVSSESVGSGSQLAKVKAAYEAAKNEFERDGELLKDNIISQSHYEQSRLAYQQAKIEYEALSSNSGSGGVNAVSPISGWVKEVYVSDGTFVEAGAPIATVSQNRRMKLSANVSERYAAVLPTVTDAIFRTQDGQTFSVSSLGGRVSGFARTAQDHWLPVLFEFNQAPGIVAGSFVEVWLKASSTKEVISLPQEAIVESQGIYSVFVRIDEDCFEKRNVTIGESDGERVVIISGLKEGEDVVTKGAMQIKLASVATAPAGHNHSH